MNTPSPSRARTKPPNPQAPAPASETLARNLFLRTAHGIRPGLDIIRRLLDRGGRPEREWLCVHVAGTNGKGSVCAMLERMLRAAGFKTGLYTSPHLVSLHERFRINGRPISEAVLVDWIRTWETEAAALEREESTRPVTFFEITTAMAFDGFRREAVDVAVIETGMGGRWDATNVVTPAVSVITDVGMDHMDFLGDTLREIAGEKAGILKPGRPAVCSPQEPEALDVLIAEAKAVGAALHRADERISVRRGRKDWTGQRLRIESASGPRFSANLPLLGEHQVRNAALAVAALEVFFETLGLPFPERAAAEGLERVCWPARMQRLQNRPPVLLDGAHNAPGAAALARALRELAGHKPVGLVCGMLADKDAAGFLDFLRPEIRRAWAVNVPCARALPREDLARHMRAAGMEAATADLDSAIDEAKRWAEEREGVVCIAGSLYLAGEVLRRRNAGDLFAEPEPLATSEREA